MNKALDEIRKEQQNQMDVSDAKIMKGNRFLFLRNYEDLGTEKQSRLETLLALNEPLFKAYSLKEQFRHFWEKGS